MKSHKNQIIFDDSNDVMLDIEEEEFEIREPIEELAHKIGPNKFVYDPENGGGRRRRIKKVSRIEMIREEEMKMEMLE
jgi:hypothetical protein